MNQLSRQYLSVDLEQNDCLQIINLLGTYGKNNGEAWASWANQINKIIQSNLDKYPNTQKVQITLDEQNWGSIEAIIQNTSKGLGEGWSQWSQRINKIIEDARRALRDFPIKSKYKSVCINYNH